MCLPAAVRLIKIGTGFTAVNHPPSGSASVALFVVAVVSLLAWLYLAFLHPVAHGAVHLLLALGVVVLVRWWALRDQARG